LLSNETGSRNTVIGYLANVIAGSVLSNATAIGANARIDCSNCMVLGSVSGINSATSGVNVGIGTTLPVARLHVADSSVLFSAISDVPGAPGSPPQQGAGRRMMWYADKAAFRVGYVISDHWDKSNIGNYSFAAGKSTLASGNSSTALGIGTSALGNGSTALGTETLALGDYSTSMGVEAAAMGFWSTAIGTETIANGGHSTAIGNSSIADGDYSLAMGENTNSKSGYETVLGRWNTQYTAATPFGWVSTDRLFSIGNGTGSTLRSDAIVVLKNGFTGFGISNPANKVHIKTGNSGAIPFTSQFTALVVENNDHTYLNILSPEASETGILFGKPSSAASGGIIYNFGSVPNGFQFRTNGNITRMEIYNNGNAWLQGTLMQASDLRLKKDVLPLQNSLQKITQLNGYTYHWINEKLSQELQTGVVAQEVQKLFPELVHEDVNGILSVNYSGLIPVLIESTKELKDEIDILKKQNEEILQTLQQLQKNNK